jgi:hypothetical protein
MQQRAGVERPARTGMLVSQVDLNAFNKALISWILVSHITLTVVEVPRVPPPYPPFESGCFRLPLQVLQLYSQRDCKGV